jgi:phosphatidylserine/phosphatidylglycerophosphate/cardiolipin synthase-like enzyme
MGDSAKQAEKSFNRLWNSDMVSGRAVKSKPAPWSTYCGAQPDRKQSIRDFLNANSTSILAGNPYRTCQHVNFYVDDPEFGNPRYNGDSGDDSAANYDPYMSPERLRMKHATAAVLNFLDGVKTSLKALNYMYIPYGYVSQAFSRLRDQKKKVSVVTNLDLDPPPTPDFLRQAEEYAANVFSIADSAGSQTVKQVSGRENISDAFELTPANATWLIHAKVLVRDSKDAVVGSFNLDPRSYSTNVESVVVIKNCPEFASDSLASYNRLEAIYDRDLARGALPPLEEISAFAKAFAMMNLIEL